MQETGFYDYGWRQYLSDIGRWNGMDQLAEHPEQIDKSPYAFTWNNPINLVDEDGRCPDCPDGYQIGQAWKDRNGIWWTRREQSWYSPVLKEVFIDEVIVNPKASYISSSSGGGFGGFYFGSSGFSGLGSFGGNGGGYNLGGVWRDTKEEIYDTFINFINNKWNSPLARLLISDTYNVGISMNWAIVGGFGANPLNITILTRGKDAGIYFTPTLNASLGDSAEVNLGIAISRGWYTGNPQYITASDLSGHTLGVSAGIGLGPHGSAGISYSFANNNQGFINFGGQLGAGAELGFPTGVGVQANYQYTPAAFQLYQYWK